MPRIPFQSSCEEVWTKSRLWEFFPGFLTFRKELSTNYIQPGSHRPKSCEAVCPYGDLSRGSREVDRGFGLDDEEGVGVGAAGVAKFLAGFVEGVGEDGEDDFALGAA